MDWKRGCFGPSSRNRPIAKSIGMEKVVKILAAMPTMAANARFAFRMMRTRAATTVKPGAWVKPGREPMMPPSTPALKIWKGVAVPLRSLPNFRVKIMAGR